MRTDSTVVEADVRYTTDAGLAATGVRLLARAGQRLAQAVGEELVHVRDRSRAVGRRLRALTRTLRRRTGEAHDEVLCLTAEASVLLDRSLREARRAVERVRSGPSVQGAVVRRAIERLARLIGQAGTVIDQIDKRVRDEPIADRLVSFADPEARPVRKGKIATRPSSATSASSPS
jgi:IS5 family transposase